MSKSRSRQQTLLLFSPLLALGAPAIATRLVKAPPVAPTAPAYLDHSDGTTHRTRPNLTGVVVDERGKPVVGATILVYTAAPKVGSSPYCPSCYPDCQKHETTNSKGAFKITSLDPALTFTVLVIADQRPPQFIRKVDPFKGALDVKLPPAPPPADPAQTVQARLMDENGKPVSGATVEANAIYRGESIHYGDIPGVDPVAITDRDGIFRFPIGDSNAALGVSIKARDFAPQVASQLKAGTPAPTLIHLTRGTTVTGRLTDAQQKGIAGATVQLVPVDRSAETFTGWHDIGTGPDGAFMLVNVPANKEYVVLAKMDALAPRGAVVLQKHVRTNAEGSTLPDVALTAGPGATISGRIVLSDGKPVPPGVRVMLAREETWDEQFFLLGKDGRFSFKGVPSGEKIKLALRVPGYKFSQKMDMVGPWGTLTMTAPAPEAPSTPIILTMEPETPAKTK